MRTTLNLLLTFTIGLLGASHAFAADVCATASNLIQNCGFETGTFSGWTVSGTDSAPINNGGDYYGVENFNQYSGNYAAYFAALGGEITLSQTVSNLIVSDIYTVTVEVFNDTTPDTNYLNNFSITIGTITSNPLTQVAAGNYMLYTFSAPANTASSVVAFNSRNDAGTWNIDSITMAQTGTPEPSAFGLGVMAVGLLGSYLALRGAGVKKQARADHGSCTKG